MAFPYATENQVKEAKLEAIKLKEIKISVNDSMYDEELGAFKYRIKHPGNCILTIDFDGVVEHEGTNLWLYCNDFKFAMNPVNTQKMETVDFNIDKSIEIKYSQGYPTQLIVMCGCVFSSFASEV